MTKTKVRQKQRWADNWETKVHPTLCMCSSGFGVVKKGTQHITKAYCCVKYWTLHNSVCCQDSKIKSRQGFSAEMCIVDIIEQENVHKDYVTHATEEHNSSDRVLCSVCTPIPTPCSILELCL